MHSPVFYLWLMFLCFVCHSNGKKYLVKTKKGQGLEKIKKGQVKGQGQGENKQSGNITGKDYRNQGFHYSYGSEEHGSLEVDGHIPEAIARGSVRLSSHPRGKVEIFNGTVWGTLCGLFWRGNHKGAENLCKQLGYKTGVRYTAPGGTGPIVAGNRRCRGGEATVYDCYRYRWPETLHCKHKFDQGVHCSDITRGSVRLSSHPKGRVEIFNGTVWGTLCGRIWSWGNHNHKGAENLCKQLGYQGGVRYNAPGGTGPIVAGNRWCRGGEATVYDCKRYRKPETSYCNHYNDQGVHCSGLPTILESVLSKIDDFTDIVDFPLEQKQEIKNNLVKDAFSLMKHEASTKAQRFKSLWVQSTQVSDIIANNSRLSETIISSIDKSINGFLEKKRPNPTFPATVQGICKDTLARIVGTNIDCQETDKYRSLSGVCNNLQFKTFGAAGIPMRRFAQPAYADGKSKPRTAVVGPRKISNDLHSKTGHSMDGQPSNILSGKGVTHMTMQFGQFLDHDITLTPQAEVDCCNKEFLKEDDAREPDEKRCFNIKIPASEQRFLGHNDCKSMPFTRSDTICTSSKHREQLNGITAFIDGSNIYGSDLETSTKLRTNVDGLLKVNPSFQAENLPTRKQCGFSSPGKPEDLVAGDVRAIVQPALASMHTLFLGEHNRIARKLKLELEKNTAFWATLTPDGADELLFQETRIIIGATLQKIVYKDYLPLILGSNAMRANNLDFGDVTSYNPEIDPSIMNEFATVAYRFAHSTVSDMFNGVSRWPLQFHFAQSPPDFFITGDKGRNWMGEMTGAIKQTCPKNDLIIGDALRNHLFKHQEDLAARNIQRGRDHGIPAYEVLREKCGLLGKDIPTETWNKLMQTYNNNAKDIDAFTGGLAETKADDGIVGPLFACIIGKQFEKLMSGDRFFFTHTHGNNAKGLQKNTKDSVIKRTLGHIICENTENTKNTQRDVFKKSTPPDGTNPDEQCTDIVGLNFPGIAQDILVKHGIHQHSGSVSGSVSGSGSVTGSVSGSGLGSGSCPRPTSETSIFSGWCLDCKGKDQNTGTRQLGSRATSEECLNACKELKTAATGCEYHAPNRQCTLHTEEVASATPDGKHTCYVFNQAGRCCQEDVARPTIARPNTQRCKGKQPGKMIQKDIDTEAGWIKLHCAGGCIQLHKVRFNCCFNGLAPIPKDLAIANGLCKDKERCEIKNFEKTFGDPGCNKHRRLWIWYSCIGGVDRSTFKGEAVCNPFSNLFSKLVG